MSGVDESALKKCLLSQLRSTAHGLFNTNAETKLRAVLNNAFENKSSSAVLVTGPAAERNTHFVQKVLHEYRDERGGESQQPFRVAYLQGKTFGDDRQALLQLARELGFAAQGGQNFSLNVEVIQEMLKSGKLSAKAQPTVIILESFDEFARSSRQILLYTLLDLMHRRDLLFTVIGLTCSADVTVQLEKRVVSRLNAQFIELNPPSPSDVSQELASRLTCHSLPFKKKGSPRSDDELHLNSEEFIHEFNERVRSVFGHPYNDGFSGTNNKRKLNGSDAPPLALPIIEKYMRWGVPFSSFILAAKKCVIFMSEPPYLSTSAFVESLNEMFPDKMFEVVSSLPRYNLCMFGICVRLHCRERMGLVGRLGAAAQHKKRVDISNRARNDGGAVASFSAGQAVSDFEKIMRLGPKDTLLKRDLFAILISLENLGLLNIYSGGNNAATAITHETAIVLGIPSLEAKSLFRRPELKVLEKVRRAVNEPLEPLLGETFSTEQSVDMLE